MEGGGKEGSRGARGGVWVIGLAEVVAAEEALRGAETLRAVTGATPLEATRCISAFLAVLVAEAAAAELRRVVWVRRVRGLPVTASLGARGVELVSEMAEVVETDRAESVGPAEGSRRGRVLAETVR